jgi:hypothetical protein
MVYSDQVKALTATRRDHYSERDSSTWSHDRRFTRRPCSYYGRPQHEACDQDPQLVWI